MKQSTFSAVMATNLLNVLQGYSKTIRLLLVMFLTLTVSVSAWGATETLSCSKGTISNNTMTFSTTNFTFVHAKGSGSNFAAYTPWRVYANNTVTVTAGSGVASIDKIEIVHSGTYYSTITSSSGSVTMASTSGGTTTINSTSGKTVTLTVTGTSQSRWSSIKITYTAAASCTTPPTVSSASNSNITSTTATVSCPSGITSLGSDGCSIESYGFVYGTSSNPTISNTKVQVGTTYTTTDTPFSKGLTGLTANTTYYVRPYATNGNGTAYGTQTSFKTLELPKYTVTLNAGPGTCAASVTEASAGAGVTLPTPTLNGCDEWTFAGWKTTSAVATETTTKPTLIAAGTYKPASNITLYAVYKRTEETEGTPTTTNKTYTHTITAKTWSANGAQTLTNVSWTLSNDGTYYGYDGTKGQQVGSSSSPAKSMTLTTSGFASATKITAVRISTSGASSISGNVSVKVGSTAYTSGVSATKSLTSTNTQYEFTGSSTGNVTISWSQTSSKAIYFKAIEVDYQTTTGGGNTTTTYYISVPDCITETAVTLNPNGGTIGDSKWTLENGVYKLTTEDESINLPTITRTGYTFGGWATSSSGSYGANAIIPLDGTPVTLYAIWTANTYNITYKDQGNAAFSGTHDTGYPTQHTYGTETTLKGATKIGYTFEGWYKDAACTNKVTTLGATEYTSAITLYAKWTAKALTNYRTFCDVVCDAYSFHTGTGEKETWSKEAIKCFTEAEGGYEHEWQIKDYIIPNDDDKFFVGNYGYFYNDNLGIGGANGKSRSVVSDWGNMYLAPAMDENDAEGTPRLGHAKGAKGTLRIFEDSNWDNLFVGFIPDGYKLKFGNEEYTLAKTTGTEYRSDVVQYNSTNADKNVSVGVVDADGKYVATNHTQEMRHVFLDVSKQLDGGSWSDADAKFAIYYWTNSTSAWCGFLKKVIEETHVYEGWIPADATGFKFVRYNSNQSAPGSWDNDKAWNQTGDLTFQQVQENGNLFTITDWGTGTWSTYEKYGQFAMHDNSKSKNWYVHFVPHYELTYNKNADDATGTMDIQTVAVDADNKKVTVADCGFTRPGYRFVKWQKDNTNTYYVSGVNIDLTSDFTLYAQWEKEYIVTYDADGGTTSCVDNNGYIKGEQVTVCNEVPTKTGHTFLGWSYGNNTYTAGETFTMPASDVTLTAEWTINEYTVTWRPNGGNWDGSTDNKVDTYEYGATIIKPADPTREGHRFDGWDAEIAATMGIGNLTYTAQWTRVYKITWYENGVPSYTEVPSDNPVVTWEDNIADCGEKKFYGWTADNTFVSHATTPPACIEKGITIAGDVTYYAVYADATEPANPGYTKVTTISEGTYLIATGETSGNKAYTGKYPDKTYGGTCDVTVTNQVIGTKPTSAVEVEVTLGTGANSGKFAIYDGTYYLSAPNDNALTFNGNIVYDWQLTAEGYINSTGQSARYIQLNSSANPNRFACYTTNQKKAYLYKKQTTTYKNFAVSCATYTITVTTPTGGTVTTTPADEAGAGQEITINVTPDDCKYLTALKYNDASDHSINIASTPYTFTMPAADVTVTATFADKNATDIEILTSAHRLLMQGSAFVGEQVRITYNNGDKETLNWNDSRLTFTGHNTATLGSQTVTVTYNDCGTQSASYNIEVIDGLGITFWDGDYTETIKYEPGDLVDVDNRIGQNICSGWEFAGWSETKVANESEEYVPVHNFNATDAKVLYAVYVKKKAQWTTIVTADEAKSGAKYVLAYDRYDTYYALTSSVKDVNYLAGKVVTSTEGELNSFDVYYLSAEPTADLIWELVSTGENGKWYLYNKNTAKYIDLSTQGQIHLTDLPSDKLQMESGYNDSQIRIASSTVPTYYLSWDNSNTRYNTYASSNSQEYWYTKDEEFTSTPPCSPLSATFHGNGGIVTDGVNSGDDLTITEPTRDAGITTPTASFADCNGKSWTFVGWAREEIDVTRLPVLTTDLLHDGGGNKHYDIEEDGEEFWAVFTNIGNPETKYGTITFTDADVTRQYENAKTITKSVTAMGDYDFELYHVSNASSLGIQFDHDNATRGYIKNITSLGKINSISLNAFQTGDIDDVKVYVGNMPNAINTLLTEADLQQTGDTYTYYPQKNYAYVKIEATGYCGITSISIDFGKGTQIWATTPDCSTITLSGDEIYVTATNGRAVMAPTTLTVKANQLEANADVILTSNSNDVYFSLDRSFNFAAGQAANQKPKTSLTLSTDAEGNLATTDVYIHYMPSSEGDGVPADVVISANLETPNPSISDDHTIHVRNLPAKFVIATKVGATWYALPANMTGETNPLAEVIEVDETTMTATAPNTSTYTLWPVKTTNGTGNRYTDYGDRLRFAAVNNEQRGLWANNNNNSSAIRNYAVINSLGADGLAAYEWKVTTTVVDGHWQYTLQTDQTQNQNYLRYWTSAEGTPVGPKWGTYNAGENKLYFLPVTETQPFEYDVVEWYPTKMLVQTDAAIIAPTVKVGGEKVASPVLTSKGGKLYEISNLPLETNPNKLLQVSFTADAVNYVNAKVVPIILSREAKSITGEPFATLTQKVYQYADVVVRDGATLTIDGTTDVANMLLGMTIYPTAKVSVAENKKLSVHSLTFFGGIDEIYNGSTYEINKYGVPQLSLKGILNKTITNMDYIMRVNLDQMYQVGVPYDVNLSDITYWDGTAMELGEDLYISAYDGQKRANLEPTGSWVWEVNFAEKVLKAGIGYTISADKQDATHEYSIIRMPMKSNIASGSTEVAKTVQVYAYANEKGVEITDNNKGWNYLSNPYMAAISGAEADSKLVVGYLDRNEVTEPWEWVNDTYRYVTIPSDDGTYHYQQKFKDAILNPFKSFFLQIAAKGELSFDLVSRQSAPARYLQTDNEKREVEFEVLLANDTRSDNLGLLISEAYTPAYEINADLEKMIGSMSVYTIYNGYNLAYNALSPANAEEQIPIGYVVPTVGEYTFALDENSKVEDIEHIYLFDYETSAITDLVTDIYTFTALEQKSDTRFAINVTLKSKDNAATGLDNMNTNGELPTKFIYHDKIFILHHGVIYDATGKRVITINK